MQETKYSELEQRCQVAEQLDVIKQLEARERIHKEISVMKEEGVAWTLSDEEVEMLKAFRRFKLRMRKHGETFRWQSRMPEGVQIVQETAEVIHPAELG